VSEMDIDPYGAMQSQEQFKDASNALDDLAQESSQNSNADFAGTDEWGEAFRQTWQPASQAGYQLLSAAAGSTSAAGDSFIQTLQMYEAAETKNQELNE
jgi:hypothetical protein